MSEKSLVSTYERSVTSASTACRHPWTVSTGPSVASCQSGNRASFGSPLARSTHCHTIRNLKQYYKIHGFYSSVLCRFITKFICITRIRHKIYLYIQTFFCYSMLIQLTKAFTHVRVLIYENFGGYDIAEGQKGRNEVCIAEFLR